MASVNAQTVVLNPSSDNTIYSQDNNTSNGQGFLYTGKTGPNGGNSLRRALLKFDFLVIRILFAFYTYVYITSLPINDFLHPLCRKIFRIWC